MKKIFFKILGVFSILCMCMFNVNADANGKLPLSKMISLIKNDKEVDANKKLPLNKIISLIKNDKENVILIAMATDNNYAYPTIVAMTSILENRNSNNCIDFYVMLSGDFNPSLKSKIESLKKKYEKCSINCIDMEDKLKNLYTSGAITTAAYYRVLLPDLLPDLDKILYMDVDTITLKDLFDLFNVNVDNFYFAGCKDSGSEWIANSCTDYVNKFGKKDCIENYVNSGILLINLKNMRNDNISNKLIECASTHNLTCHDQDALNWVCHDKIKIISNIYNNFPHYMSDIKNQAIIHYACTKPWKDQKMKYADIWWNYAKKSGYINEIKDKFIYQPKKIEKLLSIMKF